MISLGELRGQFSGRVFILGTGPSLLSLTDDDKAGLAGERIFGCSRIWKWNGLPLSFYVVSEQQHVHDMKASGTDSAKASIARFMLEWQPAPHGWIGLPVDEYRRTSIAAGGLGRYPYVHQAVSETLIALQVARWLGFDRFYFLGNECTRVGEVWDVAEQRGSDISTMGSDFAAAARELDGTLFDCTPGGNLSRQGIMPYVPLQYVLGAGGDAPKPPLPDAGAIGASPSPDMAPAGSGAV